MHLALQPHLIAWFEALVGVIPEQVQFQWPVPGDVLCEMKSKTPEENPGVSMFRFSMISWTVCRAS